jgi:hypothetical protein
MTRLILLLLSGLLLRLHLGQILSEQLLLL